MIKVTMVFFGIFGEPDYSAAHLAKAATDILLRSLQTSVENLNYMLAIFPRIITFAESTKPTLHSAMEAGLTKTVGV
jgi:hypothetical protein